MLYSQSNELTGLLTKVYHILTDPNRVELVTDMFDSMRYFLCCQAINTNFCFRFFKTET